MSRIRLVIFDMDGLMIDSERVYVKCAERVLKKYGIRSCDFIMETIGVNWIRTEEIYHECCPDLDYPAYQKDLRAEVQTYLNQHPFKAKKGLRKLLNYLKKEKILMAVATSTDRDRAQQRLDDVKITDYFDYMICGNDLSESKPSPQIYLKVLEHFGVDAKDALVFEDSRNGLLSAYNAGIRCVVVPDICIIEEETLKKAYRVIPDLAKGIELIQEDS